MVQNQKKILRDDPELQGCAIFGPKLPICPEQSYFGKND